MKTKLFYGTMLVLISFAMFGCSDSDPANVPGEGGLSTVKLVIHTDGQDRLRGPQTRAEQEATDDEKEYDKSTIQLFIYDANGNLEHADQSVTLDSDNSHEVTISTGNKFFYVFANVGTNTLEAKSTRGSFEKQIFNVAFNDPDDPDNPSLAGYTPNGVTTQQRPFFMGTLWGESANITADRPKSNPLNIYIGRITAKIKLHEVVKGDNSLMKGVFSDVEYRMAGVAKQTYLVGQYKGAQVPPGNYTSVISAAHETPSDPALFQSYANFKPVTALPTTGTEISDVFYVIENTTKPDADKKQYFTNTTHVRMKSKYTPTADEIWNADLTANNQTLTNGDFWTIIYNGERFITNAVPTVQPDDNTEINKYERGISYHRFPVQNTAFTEPVMRNAVLRNHYYEIKVTDIRDLGDPTDKEDPIEPIPELVKVTVVVNVMNWSKITQSAEI